MFLPETSPGHWNISGRCARRIEFITLQSSVNSHDTAVQRRVTSVEGLRIGYYERDQQPE